MKILYYDCFLGIRGDTNFGALVDLGVDRDYLVNELKKLSIADEFEIKIEKKEQMGLSGTKVDVLMKKHNSNSQNYSQDYRNIKDIYKLIDESTLNDNVKDVSKKIILVIGEAEVKVQGKPIEEILFNQIGSIDSVIDIVGAAICFDFLKVDKIMSSTVKLGSGFVKCAHGLIPAPAPVTLEILKDVPVHIGGVKSEVTTIEGAAILKAMVEEYSDEMDFTIEEIAYGIGSNKLEIPNVLRVILAKLSVESKENGLSRENTIIEVNIDDMNPEILGYLEEKLFSAGALDIYKTPIIMKKGRLGTKISILVDDKCGEDVEMILFKETSTLGMRKHRVMKKFLEREFMKVSTKYGEVLVKLAFFNGSILKFKAEYESCKELAKENNISINDIYKEINCMDIEKIWRNNNV